MRAHIQGSRSVLTIAATAILSCGVFTAAASGQTLVKNINTVPNPVGLPNDSSPRDPVQIGNRLYFSAVTGPTGRELFSLDAGSSEPQLFFDTNPGSADGDPENLTVFPNGSFVFTADTTGFSSALFVSDGTTSGTTEIPVGNNATQLSHLTLHQGEVYFFATNGGDFSRSVWKTDGTSAGTVQVFFLNQTGSYSTGSEALASTGTDLFFTAHQSVFPEGEWWLYKLDNSPSGATQLLNVLEPFFYGTRELTAVGDKVAWAARNMTSGLELWVSDGTPSGSVLLDLKPGGGGSGPVEFTTVGDDLFFSADHPGAGREVYKTDGTAAGTVRVTNMPGQFNSPVYLTEARGQLFFTASASQAGYELWTTTGIPFTERVYADFAPGAASSSPQDVVEWQDGILCRADTGGLGSELHFSNGTPANTYRVTDIASGTSSSFPTAFIPFDGQMFFSAKGVLGDELWTTDGSERGTDIFADIAVILFDKGSTPDDITSVGDHFVFTADNGFTGRELWVSDGTTEGTNLLMDISPEGSFNEPDRLVHFGGRAYFSADDGENGTEVWVTDGTPAGTHMLIDLNAGPGNSSPWFLAVYNNELYFRADVFSFGEELYATDGTAEGTRLIRDIDPGFADGRPFNPIEHNGLLYFSARTGDLGTEIWRTDGTEAGTRNVIDLSPGIGSGVGFLDAASLGDYLYFAGNSGDNDVELWRTDGSGAGTSLVANINPDFSSTPTNLDSFDDRVVFHAFLNGERQLWGTDGSVLEQLTFPPLFVNSNWLRYSNGEKLITMMRGDGFSFELVGTDGTPAGTDVIKQISPDGLDFVNLRAWHVTSGPELLFTAGNAPLGSELWVTDGTTAGTVPLVDLNPGELDSHPANLGRMGNSIYWAAFTLELGWELYSLPISTFGGWVAEPYGLGCVGSNGRAPTINATGSAELGETLFVHVDEAAANSIVSHYFSFDYALFNLSGCDFVLGTPVFLATSPTDAQGRSTLPLPLPSSSAFAGLDFWIQSVVADAGGSLLGSASATPALEVILGQ